jgi:hypothetical protein
MNQSKLRTLMEIPTWEWPEGTAAMLLDTISGGQRDAVDDEDRILALQLAGDFTVLSDELTHALLRVARDNSEDEAIREMATISLAGVIENADPDLYGDLGLGVEDPPPISDAAYRTILTSLHELYLDAAAPEEVRRRALEASAYSVEAWHEDAVRAAYFSGDHDWQLTAVYAMRWVRGFDEQILEALEIGDEDLRYEAIYAAGSARLDAAWPHISKILTTERSDRETLLAAIEACVDIRPREATEILAELANVDDEEIADAAYEAMLAADADSEPSELDYDDDYDDDYDEDLFPDYDPQHDPDLDPDDDDRPF